MRAMIPLIALVATPFLAAAAQSQGNALGHSPAKCDWRIAHSEKDRDINKCDQTPPPQPPPSSGGCQVSTPPASGTGQAMGTVFQNSSPWPNLAGWCIQLTGPVNATAVSDANGKYSFAGLPAGSYTVCEVVQTGWRETFPSSGSACPTGVGWSFDLADGAVASFLDFGNVTP